MDDKLRLIEHLYDEGAEQESLGSLLEDPSLREEYAALLEVKRQLDRREPLRPDPAIVARVVEAAAPGTRRVLRRRERAAHPRAAARPTRRFRALGAVVAVLVAVGIGWPHLKPLWTPGEQVSSLATVPAERHAAEPEKEADSTVEEEKAPSPERSLRAPAEARAEAPGRADSEPVTIREEVQAPQLAPSGGEPMLAADIAGTPAAEAEMPEEALPGWDASTDVLRLHRRVEWLEARSTSLVWDDEAVLSLDVLPVQAAPTRDGFWPAGKNR